MMRGKSLPSGHILYIYYHREKMSNKSFVFNEDLDFTFITISYLMYFYSQYYIFKIGQKLRK